MCAPWVTRHTSTRQSNSSQTRCGMSAVMVCSACVIRSRSSLRDMGNGGTLCYSCVVRLFYPCMKLTPHCNYRPVHLKTEHTESLLLLRRHVGNWPRGPAVSMRSEPVVAHAKLGQLQLLTMYVMLV